MVHAQKIMDGIYFIEFDAESADFELIRFKADRAFANFHGRKLGNELGKGFYRIGNDTLTMEFEDVKDVKVFNRTDAFPDLSLKAMPFVTFFDKTLGTGVGGVQIYVGEEKQAIVSDYAGIATLPHDLKEGSILTIKAKGYNTDELVYDGFFGISYYLTNDTFYEPMDGPRQYNIVEVFPDSIQFSLSYDFGLLSPRVGNYTLIYKRITDERAKELLSYQQEYIKFMME